MMRSLLHGKGRGSCPLFWQKHAALSSSSHPPPSSFLSPTTSKGIVRNGGTDKGSYYVTTPIFYVNGDPHIGHAYTTTYADTIAKFHELDGHDTFFLTGTDEHGQKVERSAQLKGLPPIDFVNEKSRNFQDLTALFHCSNTDFIRTTEERHRLKVEALWTELVARDMIYLSTYDGWYSVVDESFYSPRELVKGRAPTGAEVEWVQEESYFFRLSKFTHQLREHYAANPTFVVPASRQREMLRLLEGEGEGEGEGEEGGGLQDISVSRTSFSWGISVPRQLQGQQVSEQEHVVYVWLDALVNYMSAVDTSVSAGAGTLSDTGRTDGAVGPRQHYWPPDVHVVGKDILYFHSVLWPALLLAVGQDLPRRVVAHGWWMHGGQKMSKSLGNVVDPVALVDKFGSCAVRYFLVAETTIAKDGDFSEAALVRRVNADLADNLGNLVHRVLTLVHKNYGGVVPAPSYPATAAGEAEREKDEALLGLAGTTLDQARTLMEAENDLHKIIHLIIKIPREGNKYIDSEAPWTLVKTAPRRAETTLYVLLELVRRTAVLLQPFLPPSSAAVLDQLGLSACSRLRSFSSVTSCGTESSNGGSGGSGGSGSLRLSPGASLSTGELVPIFPRCDMNGVIAPKKKTSAK